MCTIAHNHTSMKVNPEIGIVAKFGGYSMKPESVIDVLDIAAHEDRSIITASAPFGITDQLEAFINTEDTSALEPVFATFKEMAQATESATAVQIADQAIAQLKDLSPGDKHRVLSVGESFSGRLLSEVLQVPYVEPLYFGSNDPTDVDELATAHHLLSALTLAPKIVAAAFFGHTHDGEVITMGRNMSDTSGAIFTGLSGSKMYENWKDVDGIFEADPKIVKGARKLPDITYTEVREAGGKFLHRNAVLWLEDRGITTHLRPTDHPEQDGTFIIDTRSVEPSELIRTIAAAPNMRYFRVKETGMNEKHGVIDKITGFFDAHGLSVDHVPTGIDNVAVVVDNGQFGENNGHVNLEEFTKNLRAFLPIKSKLSSKHVALIYLVGHGTEQNGNLARVEYRRSGALIQANVPLLGSESQPENAMSFLMVPPEQADEAVVALHEAFFGSVSA